MKSTQNVVVFATTLLTFAYHCIAVGHFLTYEDARKAVIQAEDLLTTGGRIQLSAKENDVNEIFMKYKLLELSNGYKNQETNAPGMHFFKAKDLIELSKVFKFLRQMPKGAVLHAHNSASVSSEWVIRNLTYMEGLWKCLTADGETVLTFRQNDELNGCQTAYTLVSTERQKASSEKAYDKHLEKIINLYTPIPEFDYPTITKVWQKFENCFAAMSDVVKYLPAYRAFHWRMLEEMYADNIMYAEIRMDFKKLYDISGQIFPTERSITELITIVEDFRRYHPGFIGIKTIYSAHRNAHKSTIKERLNTFMKLHAMFPNFIIGFDLVGQEDKGKPLYELIDPLRDVPPTARFFFHAGETNWYGASSDFNLLDAILLNTTRIGHGYALMKHPVLWNAVKNRGIAIEVNPISNQVLHLVWDLRNHPGGFFMSENIPIVISNDDPGFWNAKGLSYDFYYAIMSMAPNHAGLKTLKNLVWSSIRYSVLNDKERIAAYTMLEKSWDCFLDNVLNGSVV